MAHDNLVRLDASFDFFEIVPSDVNDLPYQVREIRIGGGGDVSVKAVSGNNVIIRNCYDGETFTGRIVKVFATGTTATDIIGKR